MSKSKSLKPTRRETQQTISLMIRKIQYLEESLSGLVNMLEYYIEMKGDKEEYKKYIDKALETINNPIEEVEEPKEE